MGMSGNKRRNQTQDYNQVRQSEETRGMFHVNAPPGEGIEHSGCQGAGSEQTLTRPSATLSRWERAPDCDVSRIVHPLPPGVRSGDMGNTCSGTWVTRCWLSAPPSGLWKLV